MKVCLVSQSFLPTIGGAEIAVHNLATEYVRLGVDTTVLTSSRNRLGNFRTSYKVAYFPALPRQFMEGWIFLVTLYRKQKKNRYDIVHFHKAYLGYYAAKIKTQLDTKLVITSHGGDIQVCPEIGYGKRLDPAWDRRITNAVESMDLLTAIGSSTRRAYEAITGDSEGIVDIANGANIQRFNRVDSVFREQLGIDEDCKIVLSVGRYHPAKGQEYLLRAIPRVVKEFSNVLFVFIGKRLEKLNHLVEELNINSHVRFLDQQSFETGNANEIDPSKIPNDFIVSAYKGSDIYASSSVIEAFPLTLVEAMAAGLPIVATNVWGNEDVVRDGVNGYLVAPKSPGDMASGITKLLKDDKKTREFSRNALKLAEEYAWDSIAGKYISAYRSVLSKERV